MAAKSKKMGGRAKDSESGGPSGAVRSKPISEVFQKSVDAALLNLPPKVQANIDQVLKSIDVSPLRLQDLRALGYRILVHAAEISDALKGAGAKTTKRRVRKA